MVVVVMVAVEAIELCTESPWHEQTVRVISEGLNEGKSGKVTSVSKYQNSEPVKYRLQIQDSSAKNLRVMLHTSDEVVIENPEWTLPRPHKIDWRTVTSARKQALADELAISTVEMIRSGETLELGTVASAMAEITERVGVPEDW